MKKKILEALLVYLLAPSAGRCAGPEVIDRLVAVVNRQIITLSDVEEEKKYLHLVSLMRLRIGAQVPGSIKILLKSSRA